MSTFFDAEDVRARNSPHGPPSPDLTRCVVDHLLKEAKRYYRRGDTSPITVACSEYSCRDIVTAGGHKDDWYSYEHDAPFYTTWARELEHVARAVSGMGSDLKISFVEEELYDGPPQTHGRYPGDQISPHTIVIEVCVDNHTPA